MGYLTSLLSSQFLYTPPVPTASLQNQVYIITGSNTGLGLEAARHIARLGATKIVLAVRTVSKGEAAVADLVRTTGSETSRFEVWPLDLSNFESVKAFGKRVQGLPRLDAVIQNAGILTNNWKVVEGMESTIAVNVVGAALVGFMVLPKLRESANKYNSRGRLSFVGSDLMLIAKFKEYDGKNGILEALGDEARSDMNDRYNVSKLLLFFAVRSMAEQSPITHDSNVVINFMSPGACKTEIFRDDAGVIFRLVMKLGVATLARTAEVGGRTLVNAADPEISDETHGAFIWDTVTPPGPNVESEKGKEMQKRLKGELWAKLESIQPGVTQI